MKVTVELWQVWGDWESTRVCEGGCGFIQLCRAQGDKRWRTRWLCRNCFEQSAEHDRLMRLLRCSNGDIEHASAIERVLR